MIYLVVLESPISKPLWMTRVVMIASSFLRRVENILAYNGKAGILFTILFLLVGRVARTFTTPSVWLLPVTSDPWECLVANILRTDILDSFLLPLNLSSFVCGGLVRFRVCPCCHFHSCLCSYFFGIFYWPIQVLSLLELSNSLDSWLTFNFVPSFYQRITRY